jgi:regulator of sigma E protease
MDGLVMTAQIILSLSILVGLHEFGHLLSAKFFGMRVEQFSIGFPPKIFSFNYGETEYALSLIPLGGYVKISGMIDESMDVEAMKEEPKEWEFRSKPAWQRLIVMLGGIFVNVILGIVIFIGLTYFVGDTYMSKDSVNRLGGIEALELAEGIGLEDGDQIIKINGKEFDDFNDVFNPDNLLTEDAYYTVMRSGSIVDVQIPSNFIENFNDKEMVGKFIDYKVPLILSVIAEGSVAERSGLQKGDKITKFNGIEVFSFQGFASLVQANTNDTVTFSITRGAESLSFKENFVGETVLGVRPETPFVDIRRYGLGESVVIGTNKAFGVIFIQLKAFKKIFSGDLSLRKSLSGPIGIAQAYGGDWQWERFWRMTGLLSMVLAFMNLLPIPALDGGHVVFLTYEILSGRKPSDKVLEAAQKVGMVILLALMVFVFGNDIFNLVSKYF